MKYLFFLLFSTFLFAESFFTFQRNNIALVQNGIETIEKEATFTNLDFYCPMQGNALDYSKNDNDGTVHGAISTGTNYYFDGVNDKITLTSQADLGTNATVTYWCNYATYGISGSPNQSMVLSADYPFGVIAYCSKPHNNSYYYNGGWIAFTGILPTLGTWENWTWVQDCGNMTIKLYTNGIFAQSKNLNILTNMSLKIFGVGGNGYNYDGYMKDIRGYNRALTAQEILNIYNETK